MGGIRLPYRDRAEGGRVLAAELASYAGADGLLVLGLPRGGVVVAHEVAAALHAPLDVLVVRKLGYPGHEEYAMGAIATGGVRVMSPLPGVHVAAQEIERVAANEQRELQRREAEYRRGRGTLAAAGRTVIVVDDGLATGSTMEAAVQALRRMQPAHVCVAVPVGAAETCARLERIADKVVCCAKPSPFRGVGLWYRDFGETRDQEVVRLLDQHLPQPAGS
ncbi:phosphoribosyltransferase [Ramlibacter humi]|uniref:Phosphoribosyltransferase n=1 Tax=Ramlibacter humi TaxID=2530451 RepID=A0A4Z0BBY8_9BURK|nr:phosphoribosyltransferase family protein [Ramlibacter humi]TFY96180.1 phosphoribosyltransferase [Ramlibacter humi]